MDPGAQRPAADVTGASSQVAQTRKNSGKAPAAGEQMRSHPGEGTSYEIGPQVTHGVHCVPYERQRGDPLYRPLRIFTLDPGESRLAGSVELVSVPYEPLKPGPIGGMFEIDINGDCHDAHQRLAVLDLDDPRVLIQNGRDPSPSDPRFHQQMVYAVCSLVYAVFQAALGRHVAWGFGANEPHAAGHCSRLRVLPHVLGQKNAWYDKTTGQLCFGCFEASEAVSGRNLPKSYIFTCLSHDIIAHEVTHALLDGLRTHFTIPTRPEVLAFHEGLADLVAMFQHFSYEKVVRNAIRQSRGELRRATLLTDLARQFGHTARSECSGRPLRSVVDNEQDPQKRKYFDARVTEPHELGSVFVSAVFDAFDTVFRRKTERYIRLATGGSGVLPDGELSVDLQAILAEEGSKLASQFLNICIRAIDYCPPLDLKFGEFLRAVITADYDLVPDDPWGYREAWIEAFGNRKIYPPNVSSLAEDALLWEPPARPIAEIEGLTFAQLRFQGDPGCPANEDELRRQAAALGQVISVRRYMAEFGVAPPDHPVLVKSGDSVDLPCIQSVRTSRRVGPDGQVVFDLVAEVTQRRRVQARNGHPAFDFYGGSTVIIGPRGEVRYVIAKNVLNQERLEEQSRFLTGESGQRFWQIAEGRADPNQQFFQLLHR